MSSEAKLLEKSIREHGIDVEVVGHWRTDDHPSIDSYRIRKRVGDELLERKVSFSNEHLEETRDEHYQKFIADRGREIAAQFREEIVDKYRYDRRLLEVCPYDGGWAECHTCGAKVELEADVSIGFNPDPSDMSFPSHISPPHFTRQLDDKRRMFLELYLLGKLKTRCAPACYNSVGEATERFK